MDNEVNLGLSAKLKTNGDLVERYCADRIQSVIPSYARIWLEYVGNDGSANTLPMLGADVATHESRCKQWQRLYTMLESLALCWEIEEQLHCQHEIRTFTDYSKNLNLWMAFYSHLGRIHDMIKAIAGDLKRPELLSPFEDFWKNRHIVLHGPKVPMKWVCNTLAFPALGESSKQWHDKMQWSDLNTNDFELISVGVSAVLRELEKKFERCLAELRKIFPAEYGWKRISWPTITEISPQHTNGGLQVNNSFSEPFAVSNLVSPSGTGPLPDGGSQRLFR